MIDWKANRLAWEREHGAGWRDFAAGAINHDRARDSEPYRRGYEDARRIYAANPRRFLKSYRRPGITSIDRVRVVDTQEAVRRASIEMHARRYRDMGMTL